MDNAIRSAIMSLAIRPEEAVIEPAASVFNLSASRIGWRIKAATKMANLGEGFSGQSQQVGVAHDLSAAWVELPELITAGSWDSPTIPAKYTEGQTVDRGLWPSITMANCGGEL